ncbi:MAG: hypothetical protein KGY41_09575 [Desulfovermiculus sp.]|nr:hypothetical protein [Desulfovermiculus sp.]
MMRFKVGLGVLACLFMLCSCTGGGKTSGEEAGGMQKTVQKAVRIEPAKLQSMLSDPELLIIDLRISEHWNESEKKILGAKRFDPQNVQSWAQDLDQDKKIVTYCA